jgi:TATA-box binding protein (TBP) (component of TFIID and TFIIIB)
VQKVQANQKASQGFLLCLPAIDIESMGKHLSNTTYEPERFPGLIYHPFNNSVVCLLFASGKIVVVGGKSEKQIRQAFQHIKMIVEAFQYTIK